MTIFNQSEYIISALHNYSYRDTIGPGADVLNNF